MTQPRRPAPPRALPITYFLFGHVALLSATLVAAIAPRWIAGFFFSPRTVAVVHTVTLGWITTSILGATYIVMPLALRAELRARKVDWFICVAALLGVLGVVGHFWTVAAKDVQSFSGMVWSGGTVVVAIVLAAWRVLRALRHAQSPLAVRAHVGAAYLNMVLAAVLGSLLALNRITTVLPGSHLRDVFGHAHLAAVGWGVMMFFGVAYRLIPMFLPAKPPRGWRLWLSLVLLETGAVGLALAFLFEGPTRVFAVLIAGGIGLFFANLVWMLRHRVPAPPKLRRPDVGMVQTMVALIYLLAATGIGLGLAFQERLELYYVMAYGVVGLVGFLGQAVLGIGMRLLPMYAWLGAWVGGGYGELPKTPHDMPARPLQWAALFSWIAGVPMLAHGMGASSEAWVSAGGWCLTAGTLAAAWNTALVLRHGRGPA